MDVCFRSHRHQERQVIHALRHMWNDVAHPSPRLAVLFPVVRAFHQIAWLARGGFDFFSRIELVAAAFDHLRYVTEQIALVRPAIHEQLNDSLHLCWMMQAAVELRPWTRGGICEQSVLAEQMRHRDATQAAAESPKEFAARYRS